MASKDCVLNELSLRDFDPRRHDALTLMLSVVEIQHVVAGSELWVWEGLLEGPSDDWQRFTAALRPNTPQDRVKVQKARSSLSRASYYPTPSSALCSLADDDSTGTAHGLSRAYNVDGLAISLASATHWEQPWLDVALVDSATSAPSPPAPKRDRVRNASDVTHTRVHESNWPALNDIDRLRILLAVQPLVHVPASSYVGGKHVKGRTNEERRNAAQVAAAASQFLAEVDGTSVTDAVIAGWEHAALNCVRNGEECKVVRHGGAYHVFCDLGFELGFASPAGEPTSRLRVEWSAGAVHSHPRAWATKDFE